MSYANIRICEANVVNAKVLVKHNERYSALMTIHTAAGDMVRAKRCRLKLENNRCRMAGMFLFFINHGLEQAAA